MPFVSVEKMNTVSVKRTNMETVNRFNGDKCTSWIYLSCVDIGMTHMFVFVKLFIRMMLTFYTCCNI